MYSTENVFQTLDVDIFDNLNRSLTAAIVDWTLNL